MRLIGVTLPFGRLLFAEWVARGKAPWRWEKLDTGGWDFQWRKLYVIYGSTISNIRGSDVKTRLPNSDNLMCAYVRPGDADSNASGISGHSTEPGDFSGGHSEKATDDPPGDRTERIYVIRSNVA